MRNNIQAFIKYYERVNAADNRTNIKKTIELLHNLIGYVKNPVWETEITKLRKELQRIEHTQGNARANRLKILMNTALARMETYWRVGVAENGIIESNYFHKLYEATFCVFHVAHKLYYWSE